MKPLLIFQSSDPFLYFPLLAVTQRTAALYAQRWGYEYEAFVGIKRGIFPWHACFNRISMLCELISRGEDRWVLYLDADSYIVDLQFDCSKYLMKRKGHSFVMAPGGIEKESWCFNDGIFFADLSNPICRDLCQRWYDEFEKVWPETRLVEGGDQFQSPADQELFQEIIRNSGYAVQNSIFIDRDSTFNYQDGKFARQVIRAHHSSLEERIKAAEMDILASSSKV